MTEYLPYILVMAVVTYLIRMLPLTFFQKEIRSPFIKSFLFYVPYAVLGAMTFPAIFTATGHTLASCAGCFVGLVLAYQGKGLCCGSVLYYGISGSLYLLKQAGGSRAPVQKPALFFNADSCISTNAPRNRIPSFCLCDPASLYFCI